MEKKTPLFQKHIELKAKMHPFAGFDMPTATYWSSTFRKAAVFNAKHLEEDIMFFAPVGFPVRPVCK